MQLHVMRGVAAVVALSGLAGMASAHIGDVGLALVNGRLATGIVEEAGTPPVEFVSLGERVFGADFTLAGGEVYTDEPGFYGSSLSAGGENTIPASSSLNFRILGNLRLWEPATSTFSAAAPGERLRIEFFGGAASRLSPLDGSTVGGFSIPLGPTGGFDEHWDFFLDAAPGQTAPGAGIYLLSVDIELDNVSGSRSEPIWLVFNNGLSEAEHDEAIEYVESNIVPTPGAVGVLGLAGLFAARRRRR
jgi:hypothetical protein